ncbi:glycosyltransferase family A protein [Lachnospiraceae bacterium 54-53]
MKPHAFAVCAYKDSPYLEACIRSLKGQSVETDILLCTSTPSPYISELADKYGIPVFVRQGKSNIRDDWNFAYHMADARFVTIAHQDDLYRKDYVKKLLECYDKYPDMTLFTGGYAVVRRNEPVVFEKVEFIKRFLRFPLRFRSLSHLSGVKRSVLMLGNSICCPACAYNKEQLGEPLFTSPYKFALDWDTLYKLSGLPGRFICVEKPILFYRVHEEATTKACITDNSRAREEAHMFAKMWPEPVVKALMRLYRKAYEEYE